MSSIISRAWRTRLLATCAALTASAGCVLEHPEDAPPGGPAAADDDDDDDAAPGAAHGPLARPPAAVASMFDPCNGHGEPYAVIGGTLGCHCDPYWGGTDCSQPAGCSGHGEQTTIPGAAPLCRCAPFWSGPSCERCGAIGGCELHLSRHFPQELRVAAFEQGAALLAVTPNVLSPELAAISVQSLLGVAGVSRTVVIGTPTFARVDTITLDGAPFPQTTMTIDVDATLKAAGTIGATLTFTFLGDRLHPLSSQHTPAAIGRKALFSLDTRCGATCYHTLTAADGYADISEKGRVVLPGVHVETTDLHAALSALPEVTP